MRLQKYKKCFYTEYSKEDSAKCVCSVNNLFFIFKKNCNFVAELMALRPSLKRILKLDTI